MSSILPDVIFSVRLSSEVSFSHDEKVVFDNVISNVGNGYDVTTGNFSVPHNGTYELTLTTMGSTRASANIMRGEAVLCQAYSKEGSIISKGGTKLVSSCKNIRVILGYQKIKTGFIMVVYEKINLEALINNRYICLKYNTGHLYLITGKAVRLWIFSSLSKDASDVDRFSNRK